MRQTTVLTLAATLWIGPVLAPAQSLSVSSDNEIKKASALAQSHPTDAAWSRLGDAFMQKARETMDVSYYGRAEAAFRKSLGLNPNYPNALVGLAWVESGRHEFEKSVEWVQKALKVEPDRSDAYGLLGDAATEMGDYESAFEHYQKMLDLRPGIASYSRGARLMYLTGDTKKAKLLLTKAIGSGGAYMENTAWCIAQMAQLDFAQGSYLSASQMLSAGLQQQPNSYHLLAAMGRVKAALKDYPAAIDYYRKAQAIVPQHDVVVALGDLYNLLGRTADANRQYAIVLSLRALNRANGVIGDAQMALFLADHEGDPAEALRLAEAEYKTRPTIYGADTLAWCYYKSGRIPEARKYIAKALSHNTPDAMLIYHKGVILAKAGETSMARKVLYQALSQNPQFDPLAATEAMKMLQELGAAPTERQ